MSWEEMPMNWTDVDWELWKSEVVWMFLKNKEGVPNDEHLSWHWRTGYGPAQTYYKISVAHQPKEEENG